MVFLWACFGPIIVGVHSQPLNTMDFTSSMIVVKRALPSRATFLVHYAHDEEMWYPQKYKHRIMSSG